MYYIYTFVDYDSNIQYESKALKHILKIILFSYTDSDPRETCNNKKYKKEVRENFNFVSDNRFHFIQPNKYTSQESHLHILHISIILESEWLKNVEVCIRYKVGIQYVYKYIHLRVILIFIQPH